MAMVMLNDRLVPAHEAVVSVQNRAFRYGDGLFESIRVVQGRPVNLAAHIERLHKGMAVLKMKGQDAIAEAALRQHVRALTTANGILEGGRVRLTVYRQSGGLYAPQTDAVDRLLEAWPLAAPRFTLNQAGLHLGIYDEIKKPLTALSSLKTTSSLWYVLAGIYMRDSGLDEVLITNTSGQLIEAVSSNVFLVEGNRLMTPPLTDGCVAGTMRQVVLDLTGRLGLEVVEASITENDLTQAEEVLLTNAIAGVKWVSALRDRRYRGEIAETLTEELNRYFLIESASGT